MKKLLFTGLMAALFLTACNEDGSSSDESKKEEKKGPEANVEKYLKAFHGMEFEEAKKYATEESGELLDMMKQVQPMMSESDVEKAKKTKVSNVKCDQVEEDLCECTFTLEAEGNSNEETIKAKKVDGEWLAHQTKDGEMEKAGQDVDMSEVEDAMEDVEGALDEVDGEEMIEEAEETVEEKVEEKVEKKIK